MRGESWASSMAARVFLLLLVGITTAAVLAFTLSDMQRREAVGRAREQRVADRVVDLVGVLDRAPPSVRPDLLGDGPEGARIAPPMIDPGEPDAVLTRRLAARLNASAKPEASAPGPTVCRPVPKPKREDAADGPAPPPPPTPPPPTADRPAPPSPDCRLVALTLQDGQRVRLIVASGPKPPRDSASPVTPLMLGVLALAASALALLTARFVTAPLERLSRAAAALGRDLDREPLAVEGPLEVRRAADAFNAMQSELKRREKERTYMLAAITHDLQTPLTRLRLRLEKVQDGGLRDQLIAEQAAMVELVRDGLDLARIADGADEPSEALDVDSLLESLCADAVEAGAQVEVVETCGCVVSTRSSALKRCVANLLDNAIRHAGSAELSARVETGGSIAIRVLDRGPGIPADRLADVFEPFVRLEPSRSRETGGVGLGLTITRLLAQRAQAELALTNRPGGGLEALLRLRPAS